MTPQPAPLDSQFRLDLCKSTRAYYAKIAVDICNRTFTSRFLEDILQEIDIALWKASGEWNPVLGVPFSKFCYRRVKGQVYDCIRQWSPSSRNGHTEAPFRYTQYTLIPLKEAITLPSPPQTSPFLCDWPRLITIGQYRVIRMLYFEGLSQAETAKVLGIHFSRVSQIHTTALKRLRKGLSANIRDTFTPHTAFAVYRKS